MKRTKRNNKGFSLVELIIVIAIMAILAGVLAPQFVKYIGRSRTSTDIQNAQQIATALSAEFADKARATEVTQQVVSDANSTKAWDDTTKDADTDNRSQKDVFGGVPKVKADSDYHFVYSITKSGEVTVSVTKDNTNLVELYPEVKAGSDWDK